LPAWLGGFGDLAAVGVEGTGSYGVGLARYLTEQQQVTVIEASRPNSRPPPFVANRRKIRASLPVTY